MSRSEAEAHAARYDFAIISVLLNAYLPSPSSFIKFPAKLLVEAMQLILEPWKHFLVTIQVSTPLLYERTRYFNRNIRNPDGRSDDHLPNELLHLNHRLCQPKQGDD